MLKELYVEMQCNFSKSILPHSIYLNVACFHFKLRNFPRVMDMTLMCPYSTLFSSLFRLELLHGALDVAMGYLEYTLHYPLLDDGLIMNSNATWETIMNLGK